jgi:hypothetical protein
VWFTQDDKAVDWLNAHHFLLSARFHGPGDQWEEISLQFTPFFAAAPVCGEACNKLLHLPVRSGHLFRVKQGGYGFSTRCYNFGVLQRYFFIVNNLTIFFLDGPSGWRPRFVVNALGCPTGKRVCSRKGASPWTSQKYSRSGVRQQDRGGTTHENLSDRGGKGLSEIDPKSPAKVTQLY